MKYSIDAYHRCILPRYILPFCFGNLNSRDYHGDSLNAMFSWFPNYFLPFLLVFMYFSPDVSKVSFGVTPVSYCRFCKFLAPNLKNFLHLGKWSFLALTWKCSYSFTLCSRMFPLLIAGASGVLKKRKFEIFF